MLCKCVGILPVARPIPGPNCYVQQSKVHARTGSRGDEGMALELVARVCGAVAPDVSRQCEAVQSSEACALIKDHADAGAPPSQNGTLSPPYGASQCSAGGVSMLLLHSDSEIVGCHRNSIPSCAPIGASCSMERSASGSVLWVLLC